MRKRAVQLRELLTKLGPSFVKVGQALSSRPDLLPKPYLEVCSFILTFIRSFARRLARSLTHSFIHSLIHSLIHSFIRM